MSRRLPVIHGITERGEGPSERIVEVLDTARREVELIAAQIEWLKQEKAALMAEASTEALVISPTAEGLADFKADSRWRKLEPTKVRPWTDDYVNLFDALIRSMKARVG